MDSSGYARIGEGLGQLILTMFVLLIVFVPLGVWKLIEIIIWLCHHIHWG